MFLELLRIAYGLAELTMPATLSGALLDRAPDKRMRIALRVLGARNVVQGVGTLATRGRLGALGGVVDLTHAASMVGLALFDARRRRAALLSASTAALFAAGEFRWLPTPSGGEVSGGGRRAATRAVRGTGHASPAR